MVKSKKSKSLNSRLGSLRIMLHAFSLIAMGGGAWYLFTSGEAIKSTDGQDFKAKSIAKFRDTVVAKPIKHRDTITFTPLEKFEAQAADSFFTVLATRAMFSGSALVAHEGKIVYTHQFGFSNIKTKNMITDTSEFQLGSVSKQFTAVSIMMLKEKGLLSYDDLISKYFPDFPYEGVTIRMCLDHRSGLPNYMFTCSAECRDQATLIDNMDVMQMLAKYKPARYFRPDKKFNYCNTNYCVLAALVEKITGKTFADFARENIFVPLHMTRTFVYNRYDTVIPNRITGYNKGNRKAGFDFLDGVDGDKGVYSTVTDLLKWDQALYGNKLVSQATLKEAYTPHTRWMGGHSYGFGWRLFQYAGDTIIYHGGWWHGFNADFIRDVKQKNTIIVLSNHINWCINRSRDLIELFRNPGMAVDSTKASSIDKEEESGGM